jgi:hypothetical protein
MAIQQSVEPTHLVFSRKEKLKRSWYAELAQLAVLGNETRRRRTRSEGFKNPPIGSMIHGSCRGGGRAAERQDRHTDWKAAPSTGKKKRAEIRARMSSGSSDHGGAID